METAGGGRAVGCTRLATYRVCSARLTIYRARPGPPTVSLRSRLSAALASFPTLTLSTKPSPLQRATRLSEQLGADVWLKRDDLLGPAFGGNKVRKLELLLADALAHGADSVITCGAAQSNHC